MRIETTTNSGFHGTRQPARGSRRTQLVIPELIPELIPEIIPVFIPCVLFLLLLSMLTVQCGSGSHRTAEGTNLLVITLDTMRADHLGAYGYTNARTPNIDRMAREGVMFKNCYTTVPITLPAHSTIFTGRTPLGHRVRTNGTYFLDPSETTLAEVMKQTGYRTYAVIASYVLLAKFGLQQGFDTYDDSLNIERLLKSYDSEITAQQVYTKFNRWFLEYRENKTEKDTFFAWVHLYDPHKPYAPPEEYNTQFPATPEGRYDGEIAYTDSFVGKIIDDLENAGELKNTVVVIVGDHGEAFGEHGEFGHSLFCYEESLKVPLIFWNPTIFGKGRTIDSRVGLIDIMPTLLELYRQEIPGNIHGKSLLKLIGGNDKPDDGTYYIESMHGKEENGWAPLTGILHEQYKYVALPEPELYDLSSDPKEKKNLFWKKNRLAKSMDKRLMELIKKESRSGQKKARRRELSDGDKEHLKTLGYISAFSDKTETNLDPKKGILLENQFKAIDTLIGKGNLDDAEKRLKEMAAKNPENLMPQYFGMLNRIYKERKDFEGAVESWKAALKVFPRNDNIRINLALEYFHRGLLDEAERHSRAIIKNNEKYTRAYILLGRIEERRADIEAAAGNFAVALRLEPQNVTLRINYARLLGQKRDYGEAMKQCDQLLAQPSVQADPVVKGKVGIILAEIQQNDRAYRILSEIAADGKAAAEVWNYLGILHFRKGAFTDAQEAYRKSIQMDAGIAKTYNNQGTLFLTLFVRQKDVTMRDRAIESFNKALELEPKLVSALNGRGSALKFANRVREALSDWETALSIKPSYTDVYFNLGITYLQLNQQTKALAILNRCKDNYYGNLSPRDKRQLEQLIRKAGG
jgi:arylsulfatase A-like enzyme/Tfp pilus assembly protein PilF